LTWILEGGGSWRLKVLGELDFSLKYDFFKIIFFFQYGLILLPSQTGLVEKPKMNGQLRHEREQV
jgi:hypothetical protein